MLEIFCLPLISEHLKSTGKVQKRRNMKTDKLGNKNRMDEREGHPVGTGVGAVGGAAAGAAVGSVAGPIGTGVGAVAGAVAGAAAGHGAAEAMEPTRGDALQEYIDYEVVDRDDENIGTLEAVWADTHGNPAFLAVRTGWLRLGQIHIVPADRAEVSDSRRKLRLPYSVQQVKSAPSFASADEINAAAEEQISSYYSPFGYKSEETTANRTGRNITGTSVKDSATGGPRSQRQHAEDATMRLKEEQVKVGKREVEYGGIRLRKIIRTETVNRPVELRREEIVIERVPANDKTGDSVNPDFNEREIYIPLRREEAVVQKETRVREEVRVGKKAETEKRNISETIRREDVEIEEQGEARKPMSAKTNR
jgi:uncharacterized protein (TIGR02271 family)